MLDSVRADGTVPIRIIQEGKGSTAVYSREFLQANKDIFANRPMYLAHPEGARGAVQRNPNNIAARTGKVVEYRIVEGVAGLYTDAKPRSEYRELVEEFGDLFGVSIFAPDSTGSESDSGEYLVESVVDSPLISIDFVSAAGAGGRIEALRESLAAVEQSIEPSAASAQEIKEMIMEKELTELRTLVESFIADSKAKAVDEVQAKVDAKALQESAIEAVEAYDAKVVLIEAAVDLLPSQRTALRSAAKRGEDVAPLIEEAKKFIDEAKNVLAESAGDGRVFGASGADEDWTVAGVRV